ncbi:MAG TPA: methyltransferase domain-containing protein [Longimicrobiales bacterium]
MPTGPGAAADARGAPFPVRHPSALDLARLSRLRVFPPGGVPLYRHIARLAELGPDREFLLAPCGTGVTAQFLAETSGASGAGVDPDPALIEADTARTRAAGLAERLHFESGPLTDLPYQDAVFDVAVGEVGLASADDPAAAVAELARVTKPMGTVVLVQLIWAGNIDEPSRDLVVQALGVRPLLLVEWKQHLRDAGVVDLYVEDWSDAAPTLRHPWTLGGLAEFHSVRDRLAVLLRAARRWGWREVLRAMRAWTEVGARVADDRILGLSLIRGTKWVGPDQAGPGE